MALRDINLIADDIVERRYLLRHLLIWCGCLVLALTLIIAVQRYQFGSFSAAERNLPGDDKVRAALAAKINEVSREQQVLNLAVREQARLSAVVAGRRFYSPVIAKLAGIMNDRTWLKQLDLSTGRDGTAHLKLLGLSLSQEYLGNFIQRLSAGPLFRGVVLKYTQEAEVRTAGAGASPVQFQIECDISGDSL